MSVIKIFWKINVKDYLLFKNYIKNRIQRIKIVDTASEGKKMDCGIPQGTALGPVLFIVYVNDIQPINH